jgi:Spy/CpxP family protein refolding chaperone
MKKGMRTIALLLGITLTGGAVTACRHHGSPGDHVGKLREHIDASLEKAGASKEQRTKIGGIEDQILADGRQICRNNQGLSARVVGCLLLDTPDRGWLHTTVDEKARELTAFAHRTVDRLVEISAILTPEQRLELKKGFEANHGSIKPEGGK